MMFCVPVYDRSEIAETMQQVAKDRSVELIDKQIKESLLASSAVDTEAKTARLQSYHNPSRANNAHL